MENNVAIKVKCPYCNKEYEIAGLEPGDFFVSVMAGRLPPPGEELEVAGRLPPPKEELKVVGVKSPWHLWLERLKEGIAKVVLFSSWRKKKGVVGGNDTASFSNALSEANDWIDMKCPNCGNSYQYNSRLKKVHK